jgi:DNA-binding transcriptional ArsR family regulator
MVIDDVFAVIAESTRRGILTSLRSGDKAVGELVEEMGVSQPTVSKHLKVLREAGLVRMRAEGQRRYYALDSGPLNSVASWLAWFDVTPNVNEHVRANGNGAEPTPEPEAVAPEGTIETSTDKPAEAADMAPAAGPGQPLQRSVGRAAGRAVDLFYSFPKLRRRR